MSGSIRGPSQEYTRTVVHRSFIPYSRAIGLPGLVTNMRIRGIKGWDERRQAKGPL